MNKKTRTVWLTFTGAAVATMMTGCQVWVPEAGITLPTPHYLGHPAQYIPPSPPFPLSKELSGIEDEQRRQLEEDQQGR